jgi:hypothetical protein
MGGEFSELEDLFLLFDDSVTYVAKSKDVVIRQGNSAERTLRNSNHFAEVSTKVVPNFVHS